jgi:D-serine deaminase-like pyridoxal phosphate-dependent protein
VTVEQLQTPAVLVERSRAIANIQRMQRAAAAAGMALRPHAKTHKSPLVAGWQIEAGAVGVCCAKLGEAEVFAEAGIADIRVPYPLQPSQAARVLALQRRVRLSFVVDHLDVARGWSEAMTAAGASADVLVKVDVGFHRCGIAPDASTAVPFLQAVAQLPGVRLRGILSHAGQAYHAHEDAELDRLARAEAAIMSALAREARAAGVAIAEISAGTTPTWRYSLPLGAAAFTEYRPGNYVYFDRTMVGLGAATHDDCALTVIATVVSAPAADRVVLDSGSKTLAADAARGFAPAAGHGDVFRDLVARPGAQPDPHLIVERLSEEHATVRVRAGADALVPGDRVRVLPNHACVVSNLVDRAWLVDGSEVVGELPIAARGRIQ